MYYVLPYIMFATSVPTHYICMQYLVYTHSYIVSLLFFFIYEGCPCDKHYIHQYINTLNTSYMIYTVLSTYYSVYCDSGNRSFNV